MLRRHVRGAGGRSRRPTRRSRPARSGSAPATPTAASARWPASTPPRCRCFVVESARTATAASATSTRASRASGSTTASTTTRSAAASTSWPGRWAPLLSAAMRRAGGIPLKPLIRRALRMGDELHSRNTAATLLFTRELSARCWSWPATAGRRGPRRHRLPAESDYFFLRLSMAAAKAPADAAPGVAGSSVVTAMTISCREYGIRVSGLGRRWFRGPLPDGRGQALRGLHRGRHRVDGRREPHHRDGRPRRLRPGGRLPPPGLPGRRARGDDRQQPGDVRDHRRREPRLPDPLLRLPRDPDRDRRLQGGGDRGHAGDRRRARRQGRRPDRCRHPQGADGVLHRRRERRCGTPADAPVRPDRDHAVVRPRRRADRRARRRRAGGDRHRGLGVRAGQGAAGRAPGGRPRDAHRRGAGEARRGLPAHRALRRRRGQAGRRARGGDPPGRCGAGPARPGRASSAGSGRSTERYASSRTSSPSCAGPLRDGVAAFPVGGGRSVPVPLAPFLGTVGVAPRWERRLTFSQSPEYLGDVDQPDVAPAPPCSCRSTSTAGCSPSATPTPPRATARSPAPPSRSKPRWS